MHICIYTTSYIATDQRVQRTAETLAKKGYFVKVIAQKHQSIKFTPESYKVKFINTLFKKGPLFYMAYNFRIFLSILFSRANAIYSNDLDTLPGCSIGALFRFKPLVYDSHELFTEVPELIGRPTVQFIWRLQEIIFIKKARVVITVSDGIAGELNKRYGVKPVVIRNLPVKKEIEAFPINKPTLIYQGVLNMGRGIELAIDMMSYLTCYHLLIVGKGDIEVSLRKRVLDKNLIDRVQFMGQIAPEKLRTITPTAWLGLSLEEDMGLNYRYALPNKLFDYIAANVPVLVSNLPEMRRLVEENGLGLVAINRGPRELANQVADFFENKKQREQVLQNIKKASGILNWQNEQEKLLETLNVLNKS